MYFQHISFIYFYVFLSPNGKQTSFYRYLTYHIWVVNRIIANNDKNDKDNHTIF